jgi:hypothetical protein
MEEVNLGMIINVVKRSKSNQIKKNTEIANLDLQKAFGRNNIN